MNEAGRSAAEPGRGAYWAFVSYSHQDKPWADWLHKGLETYRLPRRIAGRETRIGRLPARLFPVFRDTDELPTSGDLGHAIRTALQTSRVLVVICSPRSAASRWVNEEVAAFASMKRQDRILCLVVDGEPNASSPADAAPRECLPIALRSQPLAAGPPAPDRVHSTVVDARPGHTPRHEALLTVIAAIIGVDFDELRRCDIRRRFQRILVCTVAALAALGLVIGVSHRMMARERAVLQMPFPHASKAYTAQEVRELEQRSSMLDAAYRMSDMRYRDGRATQLETARDGCAWNMCEAELAWARGDTIATLARLADADTEAGCFLELTRTRVQMGRALPDDLEKAMKVKAAASLAHDRIARILGIHTDAGPAP